MYRARGHILLYTLIFFFGHSLAQQSDTLSSNTTRLLTFILQSSKYDKDVSPQEQPDEPVNVAIDVSFNDLIDLDEKKGLMTTSWFPSFVWTDPRLMWKPEEFGDITYVTLPAQKLWIPDFIIYNNLRTEQDLRQSWAGVIVHHTGQLRFVPHIIIETSCRFNLQKFPFDTQTCSIYGGSWTMNAHQLSIKSERNEIWHTDLESDDMMIENATIRNELVYYPQANLTFSAYSMVTIEVVMKRKDAYYYRLFVAPAAIMMFVLPIVHFLPPDPSKLTLSALLLVATTILFEMMDDFFPSFSLSSIPLLLHYYTALLVLIFIGFFVNALSVMIGTGATKSARVPRLLKTCCLDVLGYICCVRGRTSRYDYELLHLERALRYSANREEDNNEMEPIRQQDTDEDQSTERDITNHAGGGEQPSNSRPRQDGLTEVLKTLINELQYSRYKQQIQAEWTQLAMVIDRTCGLFMLLFAIIISAVVALHK